MCYSFNSYGLFYVIIKVSYMNNGKQRIKLGYFDRLWESAIRPTS
jgi:hypothetical protein